MVPIPIGLTLDLSTKYSAPFTLSFNSSKKSLPKVMWQVAPMSSNHVSIQESNEVLNKCSFMPIFQ
jgi:hypothetical protein